MMVELLRSNLIIFILSAGLVTAVMLLIVVHAIMDRRRKQQDRCAVNNEPARMNDVAYYEDKIGSLNAQIQKLDELNERYLSFTEHISDVVKQLYSSLDSSEIQSAVVKLVQDLFITDTIEMYVFDQSDNLLKCVHPSPGIGDKLTTYAIGEGLIGTAARDGVLKIKGVTYRNTNLQEFHTDDLRFWMVSPIHFKNRIIGVLGIGPVRNPTGNERNLIRIICDITGVTLANQTYLKEWKDGSIIDPLTGLYNRRYFSHITMKNVEKSIVNKFPISICLFDIDFFKNYNDTNGHLEGDRLLKEMSDLLAKLSRKSSVIARYGGEEFIVMLPDITKDDAFIYADRVKEEIAGYPFLHSEKQPLGIVSVSGGVASFPEDANSMDKVIELADMALYSAKKDGRNRVVRHVRSDKVLRVTSG